MLSSSRRKLVQALAVSLLIHAALLSSAVRLFPSRLDVPSAAISVVMKQVRTSETVSPLQSPALKSEVAPVRPASPVVRNAATPPQIAAQEPRAEVPAMPAASSVTRDADQVLPSSSVKADREGTVRGAVSSAPREGIGADDVRQYRMSLAAAAKRFKRYPALAREQGWEGTADVALDFRAHVPGPAVVLVQSSGRGLLDDQALEMVSQAARVTFLPEGLKSRDFRVLLPVKFSLEGD